VILVVAGLAGFCFEVVYIALEAMAQRVSGPGLATRTQAIVQGIDQTSQLAGPALAGLIVAYGGILDVLPATAVLCGVGLLAVARTSTAITVPLDSDASAGILGGIRAGLATLLGSPNLIRMVVTTMMLNFVVAILLIGGPALTTSVFDRPSSYFAVVSVSAAVAGIALAVVTPSLAGWVGLRNVGVSSLVIAGLGVLVVVLAENFWVYVVTNAVIMGMAVVFAIYIRAERARLVPAPIFGRTVSIMVFLNFLPLPLAGALTSIASPYLASRPVLAVLVTGYLAACVPVLRGLARSEEGVALDLATAGEAPAHLAPVEVRPSGGPDLRVLMERAR
jgi:hypothetical protein